MQPTRAEKDALIALFRSGRHAAALKAARAMARQYPRALDAWNIRGAAARELGQLHEAEKSFGELERLAPDFAGAPYNVGLVLEGRGADDAAAKAYRRALALDADLAQAHNNLGALHLRHGDLAAALDHLQRAARLQPGWPEVHNTHGNALSRSGRIDEARAAYRRAIAARPGFALAHYNLGVLESENGDRSKAIEALRAALAMDPGNALARAMLLHALSQNCDWAAMQDHAAFIPALGIEGAAVPPFIMLALEDDPERQLARSQNWARARSGHIRPAAAATAAAAPALRPAARPERLRIGYFGADFHDHPGSRLMAGVLREHDRSRFEIHAISHGPPRTDRWRQMTRDSVDQFHDVHAWSDAKVHDHVRALRLDIAVERQGYTTDNRSDLLARRLAGVQISYLGYPSTMGASFIDYLIADHTVIPPHHSAHFSEKLIRMPHTYLPADNRLEISASATERADHGLPQGALVLCCFNNPYKITPRIFAIWMRVLASLDNAVLWLFAPDTAVQGNLRAAAAAQGVGAHRLIFAPRLANADHLARHAHADLLLDTAPCNAHTTASDALWAGLPVVTLAGEQFAARVAASLLNAVGLSELVTQTEADYEALIIDLARDTDRRLAIRARLADARMTAPLFDSALYTRHLEAGFDAAHTRFVKRLPPADISVPCERSPAR